MVNNRKIITIILFSILAISIFPSNAKCITTIGTSTIHADEGDVYTWDMTYCHPVLNSSYGIGSYMNLTIEDIGQGSYSSVTHALLLNITIGTFLFNPNLHSSSFRENYFAYNATLHYFHSLESNFLIIPTPINLTMISDFLEGGSTTCRILGNKIEVTTLNEVHTYEYNSTGHMVSYTFYEDGNLLIAYGPYESNGGDISIGYFFMVSVIFGVFALVFLNKRRIK
jgi:hypothetical protein